MRQSNGRTVFGFHDDEGNEVELLSDRLTLSIRENPMADDGEIGQATLHLHKAGAPDVPLITSLIDALRLLLPSRVICGSCNATGKAHGMNYPNAPLCLHCGGAGILERTVQ